MQGSYCPINDSSCKREECVMGIDDSCVLVDYLVLNNYRNQLILDSAKEKRKFLKNDSTKKEDAEDQESAQLSKLIATPNETLAEELIDLARSKNAFSGSEHSINYEVNRIFWMSKGVSRFNIPPEVELKKLEVESLAEKIFKDELFKEVKNLSDEKLAMELFNFAKEREIPSSSRIQIYPHLTEFWTQYRCGWFTGDSEVQLKKERVNKLAEVMAKEVKDRLIKEQVEIESKMLPELIIDIVNWASDNGISKLINQDIDTFMLDRSLQLHPSTTRSLKLKANHELRVKK